MKSLSWVFRLFDRMSGPAQKIASALGAVTKGANSAAAATNSYTRAQAKAVNAQARYIRTQATMLRAQTQMNKAQQQAVRVQNQLNQSQQKGGKGLFGLSPLGLAGYYVTFRALTAMGREALRVATIIPRTVIGGGIEHTAMKESAVAGMGVVLGSESRAQQLVQEAVRFAAITPMTTEESLKGYQQLIMGGIAPEKVLGVMSAVSDLSSINMARRPEALEKITQDLMEVQAAGKVSGRHMRNLMNWGLPRQEVFNQLTQILPALHGATPDVVEKAVSAGKISAEAFFLAFERAMAVKGGGKLGGISEKQSRTMLGLWSTLISRPQELLMNMDKTPAWEKLKTALENLVNVTDYNSPTGAKIQEALSNAFSRWVSKLTDWLQKPEQVEAYVNRWLNDFEAMIPAFEKLAEALPKLAIMVEKAVGWLVGSDTVREELKAKPWWKRSPQEQVWLWRHPEEPAVPQSSTNRKVASSSTTSANFEINVSGASREDAKVVAHEVRASVASLFEQLSIESGAVGGGH